MTSIGIKTSLNDPAFWVTGQIEYTTTRDRVKGKFTSREGIAIIAWAWRSLYAEIIGARTEEREINLEWAYYTTIRYCVSRAKAYGKKWRTWYLRQRNHENAKMFPLDHREHALISLDRWATYTISKRAIEELEIARVAVQNRRRGRPRPRAGAPAAVP